MNYRPSLCLKDTVKLPISGSGFLAVISDLIINFVDVGFYYNCCVHNNPVVAAVQYSNSSLFSTVRPGVDNDRQHQPMQSPSERILLIEEQ